MTTDTVAWRNRIVGHSEQDPRALRANPKNWRRHPPEQRAAMLQMLDTVGVVQNVILNRRTGNLIDGHLRVELAVERREPTIPVVEVDLSEQEEAIVLASYDPLSAMASIDTGALGDLLAGLDVGAGGLAAMLDDLASRSGIEPAAPEPPAVDPDAAPPLPEPANVRVAPGELWALGDHRLLVADATDAANWARLMDGRRAGACFTDPPYNMAYKSAALGGIENDDLGEAEFTRLLLASARHLSDALRPGGSYYVCMGALHYAVAIGQLRKIGLGGRPIVWVKPSGGLGQADYRPQFEMVLYGFTGKRSQRTWNAERRETDVWDFDPDRGLSARREGTGSVLEFGLGYETVTVRLNQRVTGTVLHPSGETSDVWRFARERGTYVHPTQKPVALVERALRNSSKARDLVVDPFLGSGTTLIAAERLGRTCYGMELDPAYAQVTIDRWEAYSGGKATLAT